MTTCEKCGKSVGIGDWPWCPHEFVGGKFGEEPMEGYWDEHLLEDPVFITTRAQRRKIMSSKGLEYHDNKFEGTVGEHRRIFYDMGKK